MCEEFGCTPSVALAEDATIALDIMELRAYAKAKQAVEAAKQPEDASGWQQLVVFGVQTELRRRRASGIGSGTSDSPEAEG